MAGEMMRIWRTALQKIEKSVRGIWVNFAGVKRRQDFPGKSGHGDDDESVRGVAENLAFFVAPVPIVEGDVSAKDGVQNGFKPGEFGGRRDGAFFPFDGGACGLQSGFAGHE